MVGWHRQLSESEQTPGGDEGQGTLPCYSPRGGKELDTTEQEPCPAAVHGVAKSWTRLNTNNSKAGVGKGAELVGRE